MMRLHIHFYRLRGDWHLYNWDGVLAQRRVWTCRCGARRVKIRGTMAL